MSESNPGTAAVSAGVVSKTPIIGHRQLSANDVDLINEGKRLAELVGSYLDKLAADGSSDKRWVAISRTNLQQGFMALTRCIARQETF